MPRIAKEKLPESQKEHISALRPTLGKKLVGLSRCQYLFNDEPDDEDEGDIELQFSDGSFITLFILSDGESVGAKSAPMEIPEPFDLDSNSHCSWRRLPLLTTEPWSIMIDTTVTEVSAIFDKYKKLNVEVLSGWKVSFGKKRYISYFNCGDNGRLLLNRMPPTDHEVESREELLKNDI